MLTSGQLAIIKSKDVARTPGRWEITDTGYSYLYEVDGKRVFEIEQTGQIDRIDAEFIALASWAIPALLDEVWELRVLPTVEDWSDMKDALASLKEENKRLKELCNGR